MRRTNQPHYNGYKVNQLTLELSAWEALAEYSAEHELTRILVVEVRIQSPRGSLYHIVLGERVDQLVKPGSKWIGFSIYDLPALSLVSLRPGLPITGGVRL